MSMSACSRADLVSELLSPVACPLGTGPLLVCDTAVPSGLTDRRSSVLAHRLDVARELLRQSHWTADECYVWLERWAEAGHVPMCTLLLERHPACEGRVSAWLTLAAHG